MIPRFKIVKTDKILPVMEFDEEKVAYLTERIRKSNSVDFTLPLLSTNRKAYLLLQDSAILEAANRLGIDFLPAQITPMRGIRRLSGEIFAEGFTPDLPERFETIHPRETILLSSKRALQPFSDRFSLKFELSTGDELYLAIRRSEPDVISPILFDLFRYISKSCRLTRSIYSGSFQTANLKQSEHWSRISILNLTAEELINCGLGGFLFPGGMLHFQSGPRLLGLDFPIDILNEKAPAREKERFLRDLISYRFATGHPEFIGSGVFLLNSPSKK